MSTLNVSYYNSKGKTVGTLALPESIFGLSWNGDLVHQVIVSMQSNARTGLAHTKGRGEVRGGGKKPWQQKGTGRARHGSSRSPIWIGGGITHGPLSEKDYSKKINKKMKAKALAVLLSRKLKDGKLFFVESPELSSIKTKTAMDMMYGYASIEGLATVNTKKSNNVLLVVPAMTDIIKKSFRNLPHVTVVESARVNPLHIAGYRYMILAGGEDAVTAFVQRLGTEGATETAEKKSPKKVAAKKTVAKKTTTKKVAKKVTRS